jgi:hypothetical protein
MRSLIATRSKCCGLLDEGYPEKPSCYGYTAGLKGSLLAKKILD